MVDKKLLVALLVLAFVALLVDAGQHGKKHGAKRNLPRRKAGVQGMKMGTGHRVRKVKPIHPHNTTEHDNTHHVHTVKPGHPHNATHHVRKMKPGHPHNATHHVRKVKPIHPHNATHHVRKMKPGHLHNATHHVRKMKPGHPHNATHHVRKMKPGHPHNKTSVHGAYRKNATKQHHVNRQHEGQNKQNLRPPMLRKNLTKAEIIDRECHLPCRKGTDQACMTCHKHVEGVLNVLKECKDECPTWPKTEGCSTKCVGLRRHFAQRQRAMHERRAKIAAQNIKNHEEAHKMKMEEQRQKKMEMEEERSAAQKEEEKTEEKKKTEEEKTEKEKKTNEKNGEEKKPEEVGEGSGKNGVTTETQQ